MNFMRRIMAMRVGGSPDRPVHSAFTLTVNKVSARRSVVCRIILNVFKELGYCTVNRVKVNHQSNCQPLKENSVSLN